MKAAVLAPAGPLNTLLRSRAAAEVREIARVKKTLTRRVALVPFQAEEPVGAPRLMELTKGGPTSAGSGPVSGGHRALARLIGVSVPPADLDWHARHRAETEIVFDRLYAR
jgi:hypothetical protein